MGKGKTGILYCLQLALLLTMVSDVDAVERRRDQFIKQPGHYILPMPYRLPGIGEGFLLAGTLNNAHDSHTDYIGLAITGAIEGYGAIAKDIHLVEKHLIVDIFAQRISQATTRNYNGRGMDTRPDDYTLVDLADAKYTALRTTGTFYERMFEITGGAFRGESRVDKIRSRDGVLIQELKEPASEFYFYMASIAMDLTDDYRDPRVGIRYEISRWWRDETAANSSDFYRQEHNITGYVPVGRISTLALNYFRADAFVTRQGDTDLNSVKSRLGCDDPGLTAEQRSRCEQLANNTVANNRYGSIGGLGGWSRLRSYPNDRYNGAHAEFYGAEFRWNLTEEFKPFDIGIAKDIRTGIQLAFFWETATISDEKDKLGDHWRDSYGMGFRMVTASGLVIRGDIATGDEGSELSVIVGYPWEGF
ncbi:MAG: hypothetical protein OEY52_01060 [Gammaproteobacteria bacterium]|nr:hypothetical protein [Gammaproteobacteria bacterium]